MTSQCCQSATTQTTRQPLLQNDQYEDMTFLEGGGKAAKKDKTKDKKDKSGDKKEKKRGCCKKKKKFKEIARNKKMLYKEFGKKRPLLRLGKVCKNLGIGAIVLSLTYGLAYSNHMRYSKENC